MRGVVRCAGFLICLLVFAAVPAEQEPPYPHGELAEDCALCHSPNRWAPARISKEFDHARYDFKLDGAHSSTMCRSCHLSLEFDEVASTCVSCHMDVHAGELGNDCASCHSTSRFKDRSREVENHRATRFPLSGAHATIDCAACHPIQPSGGMRFVGTAVACQSCHLDAYLATTNPNHTEAGLSRECESCHASTAWNAASPAGFDHAATGFPLSGAHSGVDCASCHTGGSFSGNSSDCASCHQSDYQAAPGHAGTFPTTCDDCHSVTTWNEADFDHSFFPLSGGHNAVECTSCHTTGSYATIPSDCVSCHQNDYQVAPGHAGTFPTTCQDCHSITTWLDGDFDHSFFPLSGGHNAVECTSCHTTGSYATIPSDCVSCHQNDYQVAPGHAGTFPTTCQDCHSITTWLDGDFDHSFFPLSGGHNAVECTSCHTTGSYATIPSDCVSCHQNDYQVAPGHAGTFPTTCQDCHSVTTWLDGDFDHSFFPLSGGHNAVECTSCHTTGTYATIPADCVSCHQNDYQAAPGHAGSFPTTCEDCHSVTTWIDASFDHSFFPLSGGHNAVECIACHTTGTYATIPSDCLSCHQNDYQAAPGHAGSFPTTCEDCHSVTTWIDASFDHSFFPLSGGHNAIDCIACHTTGSYATIPADCVSCHQNDYQAAPGHAGSFPTTCEDCHSVTTWIDASFDHSFFPLGGGHNAVECIACHTTGTYATIPADCVSCHQNDYQAAPGHAGVFPTTCEGCHSVTTWLDADFDHSFFPLSGGHNGLVCQQCHTSGTYGTIPTDCVYCHHVDYINAPSHVASNYPQECENCHTVTAWSNATFDHSFFPLTGAHNGIACISCHTSGINNTIPSDCISCHRSDYDQAPDHLTLQFSQDCESCHSTTAWSNVNFLHPWPLVGPHRDRNCSNCHNSGTVQDFSCLGACHEHTIQRMADKHSGESGYAYDFPLCIACHANGRE